jgi:hypothetical protein
LNLLINWLTNVPNQSRLSWLVSTGWLLALSLDGVFNCAFFVGETRNGVMGCPFHLGCGAAESVSSSSSWMMDSVCGSNGFVVRCVVRFEVRCGGSANELAG